MDQSLLRALERRRVQIRSRWKALLQIERVHTPLADPEILAHLFDQTLDEILGALPGAAPGPAQPPPRSRCACNPLRDYFPALEQALLEALVLAQAKQHKLSQDARVAAVDELRTTLRRIAQREIAVYDAICQQRARQPKEKLNRQKASAAII